MYELKIVREMLEGYDPVVEVSHSAARAALWRSRREPLPSRSSHP